MTSRLAALSTSTAGRVRMKPQPSGPLFLFFSLSRSHRKADLDTKSGGVIGKHDLGAVQVDDRCDEAQSQPASIRRAGALQPVKPAKDILPLGRRYAGACIRYLHPIDPGRRAEPQSYLCPRWAMADGVLHQIREQLKDGKSQRDVLDYMVERYGDFVLYKPPFKAKTALLWLGPFQLLLGGLLLLYRVLRQRRTASSAPLSAADQARARALLGKPAE